MSRLTREPILRSKGQGHRVTRVKALLLLLAIAYMYAYLHCSYIDSTQVRGINYNFLKISLFAAYITMLI